MATYSEMYSNEQLSLKVSAGGEREEEEGDGVYSLDDDDEYVAWEDDWRNDRGDDVYSNDDWGSDDGDEAQERGHYGGGIDDGNGYESGLCPSISEIDIGNSGILYSKDDFKFFVSKDETVEVDYSSAADQGVVPSPSSLLYGSCITSYSGVTPSTPTDSSSSSMSFNFSGPYASSAQASSSSSVSGRAALHRAYICSDVDVVKMVLEMLSGCSNDLFFKTKAVSDGSSKSSALASESFMINYLCGHINTKTASVGNLRSILKYFLDFGNDVLFCRNFYSNFINKFQLRSAIGDGKKTSAGPKSGEMIHKIIEKITFHVFEMIEIFDSQARKIEADILCPGGAEGGGYTHLFAAGVEGTRRRMAATNGEIKYHKTLLSLYVHFGSYAGLFRNLFCVCSTLGSVLDSMSGDSSSSSSSSKNEYLLVFLLQETYKLTYCFSLTSFPLKRLTEGSSSSSSNSMAGAMGVRLPPLRNHISLVDIFAQYLFQRVFACYVETFVRSNVEDSVESSTGGYGEVFADVDASKISTGRFAGGDGAAGVSAVLPVFCVLLAGVVKRCSADLKIIQKFSNRIKFESRSGESGKLARQRVRERVRVIVGDYFEVKNDVYSRRFGEGLEALFCDQQCCSDMLRAERGARVDSGDAGTGDMYNNMDNYLYEKSTENCEKFELSVGGDDILASGSDRNKVLRLRLKSRPHGNDGSSKTTSVGSTQGDREPPIEARESTNLLVLPLLLQLNIKVFEPLAAIIERNAQSVIYFVEKTFQLSKNFKFLQEIFFLGQNTDSRYDLYDSLRNYIAAADDDFDANAAASRSGASSSRSQVYSNSIKVAVSKRSRLLLLLETLSAQLHSHKPSDGVSHIAISSDKDVAGAAAVSASTADVLASNVMNNMEIALCDVGIDCHNGILNVVRTIQVEVIYSYPLSEIFTDIIIARYNYNMKILLYISVTKWKSENVWKAVMLSKMLMMTTDLKDGGRKLIDAVKCLKGGLQLLLHTLNSVYNFYSKQIHSTIIGTFNQHVAVAISPANANPAVSFNTNDISLMHRHMLDSVDLIFAGIYTPLCSLCIYGYNSAELLRQCVRGYDENGYDDDTVSLMIRAQQSFGAFRSRIVALNKQIASIVGSSRAGGANSEGSVHGRAASLQELSGSLLDAL